VFVTFARPQPKFQLFLGFS